jgi:hypothetical protein
MNLKDIILNQRLLYNVPVDPDDPPGGGGDGGPGGGTVPTLPGLGVFLRKRYTSNLAVSEEMPIVDLINDVLLPSCRGYMTQGANGKIRLHNKNPADYAYAIEALEVGETSIDVDDASPWVNSLAYYVLFDPHTNLSEIRTVSSAVYPTSQNSVTLTSNEPTEITVTAFSGATGASTPATATVDFGAFVVDTTYTITLDGTEITWIPRSADTGETQASFFAGAVRGNPKVSRRFTASWESGDDFVTLTAKFGTLTLNEGLDNAHSAPIADPTAAPTLTAAGSGGDLLAGDYQVAYAYRNIRGQTLLSPYKNVTLTAGQHIHVDAITPPAGTTVVWYVTTELDSELLRYYSENDGSAFDIDYPLPRKTASLPPDLNRTGTEIMRIVAVFSDRREPRSSSLRSNVLLGSFKWRLGNRRKPINRIDLQYREASQDWRLIELRLRDDEHIAKIHKTNNEKINGQAIDNYFQAYRIAAAELAERRDADFFYEWRAIKRAGLLEEGDVVCITDDGSGVYNLPVFIQDISVDIGRGGRPRYDFTGQKYFSTLWDDEPNDITVPIVSEIGAPPEEEEPPPDTSYLLEGGDFLTESSNRLVNA